MFHGPKKKKKIGYTGLFKNFSISAQEYCGFLEQKLIFRQHFADSYFLYLFKPKCNDQDCSWFHI